MTFDFLRLGSFELPGEERGQRVLVRAGCFDFYDRRHGGAFPLAPDAATGKPGYFSAPCVTQGVVTAGENVALATSA